MTATLDKVDGLEDAAMLPAPAAAKPAKAKKTRVATWRLIDWRVLLGALLLAGLIHIGLVISMPFRFGNSTVQRMRADLPVNRSVVIAAPVPARQFVPFVVPDAAYAVCRYDVSVDSLRVSTALLDQGWMLTLHTVTGDNFYVMPGQAKRSDAAFVIMPGVAALDVGPVPRRFGTSGEIQIPSPTVEGLVVVRAPYKGIAYRGQIEAALAQTVCAPVKR